jgi:hypothetical protein
MTEGEGATRGLRVPSTIEVSGPDPVIVTVGSPASPAPTQRHHALVSRTGRSWHLVTTRDRCVSLVSPLSERGRADAK